MNTSAPPKPAERGVAALAVVMVLLVAASLIVFFANRSLIFEQRASANQLRAARALAAAESGLEWALSRLNDPRRIDAQCVAATAASESFRERYAPWSGGGAFAPVVAARPGCRLGESAVACACPSGGPVTALAGDEPTFTVELAPVPGDGEALLVTSRGCTAAARECVPGSSAASSDAVAVVQTLIKLVPPWAGMPVAAVTSGGSVEIASGVRLTNTDAATQGLLVDAGGAVSGTGLTLDDGLLSTVPGSPIENAVLRGDEALGTAPDAGDGFFMRRFALSLAQFRASPAVRVISGCAAADCTAQIVAAGAEGFSAFYVEGDLQFGASAPAASADGVGSATRPLLVVVAGRVGGIDGARWHGLVHAIGAAEVAGLDLIGALVTPGDLRLAGGTRIVYAPEVMQRLRAQLGSFARVPGSWRDGHCTRDDASLPCGFAR